MIKTERKEFVSVHGGGIMESIKQADFEKAIVKSRMPALVIFTAPECKPCRLMDSDLQELEMTYRERVAFFRVDTSLDMELATRLSVVSTPTLILFVGGEPVLRLLGYVTKTDIRKQIDENLERYSD